MRQRDWITVRKELHVNLSPIHKRARAANECEQTAVGRYSRARCRVRQVCELNIRPRNLVRRRARSGEDERGSNCCDRHSHQCITDMLPPSMCDQRRIRGLLQLKVALQTFEVREEFRCRLVSQIRILL